jgi:hypothetical protein
LRRTSEIRVELPHLADKQSGERLVLMYERPSGVSKGNTMVGEMANAKTCEQAKGKVESGDQRPRDCQSVEVGWNCKFGNDPYSVHSDVIAKPVSQVSDFSICEAIEEEVCDD